MGETAISIKTPTAREMLEVIISECEAERDKASRDLDRDYTNNLQMLLNELSQIVF